MTDYLEDFSPVSFRDRVTVRGFWFNWHLSVVITAPVAILTGIALGWYAINGLFFNLVVVLWNPLVWVVLPFVWIGFPYAVCALTYGVFVWLPAIWNRPWGVLRRLLGCFGAWFGIVLATDLLYQLEWAVVGWVGADWKVAELLGRTPVWLQILGVTKRVW